MRGEIHKAVVTGAMMAFIRSIDPHASMSNAVCQSEIGGTLITANLGSEFESARSVFESVVEKLERCGYFRKIRTGNL